MGGRLLGLAVRGMEGWVSNLDTLVRPTLMDHTFSRVSVTQICEIPFLSNLLFFEDFGHACKYCYADASLFILDLGLQFLKADICIHL